MNTTPKQKQCASVIWITGAANGVGAQLVSAALREGFRVFATDVDEDGLMARSASDSWPGQTVIQERLDVRRIEQWQQGCARLMAQWGRLDVLINNAGVIKPGFLLDTEPAEIDLHLDVNLKGVILGSQTASKAMAAQGHGHIINIASLAGVAPVPGLGYYSVSKFGVRAYSLILAEELRQHGIRVTVLCPDLIKTAMYDLQLDYPDEAALTFSGGNPLQVEDIAKCVFSTILPKAPREVLLPGHRGWLAKVGNLFPTLTHRLTTMLSKKGKAKIARIRS